MKGLILWITTAALFFVHGTSVAQFYSNLPIIIITTSGGAAIPDEPKIAGTIGIIYNGPGVNNHSGATPSPVYNIGIEQRGSSSSSFPQKSYGFETRTPAGANLNVSLLGMPLENDWILYAPYTDKTLLRNVLTYQLWNEMGHYGPRTKFVELILNGQYQGIYVLIEKIKIDENRVDLATLRPIDISGDQVTGGYIVKVDKATGAGGNDGFNSPYLSIGSTTTRLLYHDPDPSTINASQRTYIQKFVCDTFEATLKQATFADPVIGYQKYMSISSWIDYLLINEASKNVDGYRISAFFHKNKFSKGGKFKAGPAWDYNIAWRNADYYEGWEYTGWMYNKYLNHPTWGVDTYQVPFWWSRLMEDSYFQNRTRCRYEELRTNVLNTAKLNTYIDKYAVDTLGVPQTRHYAQWPILGVYVWPNPSPLPTSFNSGSNSEISVFKTWINNRLTWMDANLPGTCSALPVNLISFEGKRKNDLVNLVWKTGHERGIRSYVVEYSTNGTSFETIGEIQSKNQSMPFEYSFEHNSAHAAIYRLRIENQDGNIEYSDFADVDGISENFSDFEAFPNPFSESVTFIYTVHQPTNIEIELINNSGVILQTILHPQASIGTFAQTFEGLSDLTPGNYIIKIRSDNTVLLKKVIKK